MYDYINNMYHTSFKTGSRVEYAGGKQQKLGIVVGVGSGASLLIKLDGEEKTGSYHPTWRLTMIAKESL